MMEFVSKYLNSRSGRVLDFGSRDVNGNYRKLFPEERWEYIGLDQESGKNVDLVIKNPYKWDELENESFDLVISGQALEHCEFFWLTFLEIARVMKHGAICCILAPSSGPEHRYPYDCWRFYPDGMRALCKFSGLTCLEAETDWKPEKYEDFSEVWKDTKMVAQKD
jgi:SAM-dependent methyltransferase